MLTRGSGPEAKQVYTGVFALQEDYERALAVYPGGEDEGPAGLGLLIITAVKFPDRDGPVFRCPKCHQLAPLVDRATLGTDTTCTLEGCNGRLRLNPFVAEE